MLMQLQDHADPLDSARKSQRAVQVLAAFIISDLPAGGGRELPWLHIRDGLAALWQTCRACNEKRGACSSKLCWARIWGDGCGGQCRAVRKKGLLCLRHDKRNKHGLVTALPPPGVFPLDVSAGDAAAVAPRKLGKDMHGLEVEAAVSRRSAPKRSPAKVKQQTPHGAQAGRASGASTRPYASHQAEGGRVLRCRKGGGCVSSWADSASDADYGLTSLGRTLSQPSPHAWSSKDESRPALESDLDDERGGQDEDDGESVCRGGRDADAAKDAVDEEEFEKQDEQRRVEEMESWDGEEGDYSGESWPADEARGDEEACFDGDGSLAEVQKHDGAGLLFPPATACFDGEVAKGLGVTPTASENRRGAKRGRGGRGAPREDWRSKEALEGYMREAKATAPTTDSREGRVLADYVEFTAESLHSGMTCSVVETPLGCVASDENLLRCFLAKLRFGGGPISGPYQLKAKSVEGRFVFLKKALRESLFVAADLPTWAVNGSRTSTAMNRMFQQWRKVELVDEKAAVKRGYLTDEHVETYCLDLMAKDRRDGPLLMTEVFAGLLLRLQSARSVRHGNLASLTWSCVSWVPSAAAGAPAVGAMDVTVTKTLSNMALRGSTSKKFKSRLLFADAISSWFFARWLEDAEAPLRRPTDFVFPHLQASGDYDFSSCMKNSQHSDVCRAAAAHLGLASTEEEIKGFASNCVRRGCAAGVVGTMQAVLAQSNKRNGRALESSIDVDVYAPDDVVMAPGALFEDLEDIEERCRQHLGELLPTRVADLLCVVCGLPCCQCPRCLGLLRGHKSEKNGHCCWLKGLKGRIPAAKEGAEEKSLRIAAWAEHGVDEGSLPVLDKGRFVWPADPQSQDLPSAASALAFL